MAKYNKDPENVIGRQHNPNAKKKSNQNKSNKLLQEERVNEVFSFLLRGYRTGQIVAHGTKNWGIGERMVEKYIKKATDIIKQQAETDREQHYYKALLRYEDLYSKNYSDRDFKECRAVQGDLNKITGILSPIKTEVTGKDGDAVKLESKIDYSKLSVDTVLELKKALDKNKTDSEYEQHSE